MRTLLMCLFIATGILWVVGVYVVAIDCIKRKGDTECVAMAVAWPVTIPIAYSGR